MTSAQFIRFLTVLSKHVDSLQSVEMEQTTAAFQLLAKDPSEGMSYNDFRRWWLSSDRYGYLIGEKAVLLRKAYQWYKINASSKGLTHEEFRCMMERLNLKLSTSATFDEIDQNCDGIVSFSEFCDWLKWF